jgi:hypothetical protein
MYRLYRFNAHANKCKGSRVANNKRSFKPRQYASEHQLRAAHPAAEEECDASMEQLIAENKKLLVQNYGLELENQKLRTRLQSVLVPSPPILDQPPLMMVDQPPLTVVGQTAQMVVDQTTLPLPSPSAIC